jgi:hypothetical protein
MGSLHFDGGKGEGHKPRLVYGDDPKIRFRLADKEGKVTTPRDLTDSTVSVIVKADQRDADDADNSVTLPPGRVTIVSPATDGIVDVQFVAADFKNGSERHFYRIKVTGASGYGVTYAHGSVEFERA